MAVNVQVLDENGRPVHCTVAAVRTSDQSILNLYSTDSEGVARVAEAGTWYPRPMVSLNYKSRIKMIILNDQNSPCYDYVVDASGGGTHFTLAGADGAWAAAVVAGGHKTIWICNSETLTVALSLDSMNDSSIAIHGPVATDPYGGTVAQMARYTITAPAAEPIFRATTAAAGENTINLRNIGIVTDSTEAIVEFNGGNGGLRNLELEGVSLSVGDIIACLAITNAANYIRMHRVAGSARYIYNRTALAGSGPDQLDLTDSRSLGLTALWNGQGPEIANIEGGTISVGAASVLDSLELIQVRAITISTGATIFTSSGTSQNAKHFTFDGIAVRATGAGAKFCDLQSYTVNNNSNLFIHGVHGVANGGISPSGTFITVDTDWVSVYVADIHAPSWPTVYSGPTSSSPVPFKFPPTLEVEGDPDALGNRMAVLDSTGVAGNILEFQRSAAAKGGLGLWATSAPAPWGANDFVFGVFNGGAHWLAAFSNDGSAFKLQTSLRMDGYARVGSDFTAPANTTDGDLTVVRLAVGNVVFPDADNIAVINHAAGYTSGLVLVSGSNKIRITAQDNGGGDAHIDLAGNASKDLFLGGARRTLLADQNGTAILGSINTVAGGNATVAINGILYAGTSATATPSDTTPGTVYANKRLFVGNIDFTTDDLFYVGALSATATLINHDADDYESFNRPGDVFSWVIGGAQKLSLSPTILQVGVDGSAPQLILAAIDGTNEGGELVLNGAAANADWTWDNNTGALRWFTGGDVKMSLDSAGKLYVKGEIEIDGALNHDGTTIGFFGVAPAVRASAYTPTNVTTDRAYDANATTVDELADVLGTLIADLQTYGLLQ